MSYERDGLMGCPVWRRRWDGCKPDRQGKEEVWLLFKEDRKCWWCRVRCQFEQRKRKMEWGILTSQRWYQREGEETRKNREKREQTSDFLQTFINFSQYIDFPTYRPQLHTTHTITHYFTITRYPHNCSLLHKYTVPHDLSPLIK